jgi:hypothetical protein
VAVCLVVGGDVPKSIDLFSDIEQFVSVTRHHFFHTLPLLKALNIDKLIDAN